MDVSSILAACQTHAMTTGLFDGGVNGHAPRNAPAQGVSCSMWPERLGPAAGASGLNKTTGLLLMTVMIYTGVQAQPYDAIESSILTAADGLFAAYSGAFTLDGLVRNVDLLGQFGTPLEGSAGYVTFAEGGFRVWTITLPLVVNDIYSQGA